MFAMPTLTREINATHDQVRRERVPERVQRHVLRNFITWCPVKRVAKLTPELVERYAAFRKRQDAAIRTINIEIGAVKTCLNWGLSSNLVPSNPLALGRRPRPGCRRLQVGRGPHPGPHGECIPLKEHGPRPKPAARLELAGGGDWIRNSDTRIMIPLL